MISRFFLVIIAALLFSVAPAARAEQLIKEFSGSRSTNTVEFEVQAPWIVDWRVSGELSKAVAVDVSLLRAATGAYEGRVIQTKYAGNGVKLFNESGRFYFRVDATMMNWTLKVIQLTKEEAKLYTPKSKSILDQ
jgi:hypothetical protein